MMGLPANAFSRRIEILKARVTRFLPYRRSIVGGNGFYTRVTIDDRLHSLDELYVMREEVKRLNYREMLADPLLPAHLNRNQIIRGIELLQIRINELKGFDPQLVESEYAPEVQALKKAIDKTLVAVFGNKTLDYERYCSATNLYAGAKWGRGFRYYLEEGRKASVILLQQAIRGLQERTSDQGLEVPSEAPHVPSSPHKIFIVYGHDEGAREAVARFLEKIGFEAIILHEQANRGRTVIEKVEAHGDVRFAVILLTPDDVGCAKGGTTQPRASQNVILELGYFIGRLGRSNVCALKRGELEIPSDFNGIVYDVFDASGAWKQAIGRELQAAGFQIDWNTLMRS